MGGKPSKLGALARTALSRPARATAAAATILAPPLTNLQTPDPGPTRHEPFSAHSVLCARWHMGCVTVCMIVTFLGTKGGTGTTTLAVNAAADIRRYTGRPTVVVDLKAGCGDVAVFLGLRPRFTLLDLIDQLPWTDRALVPRFIAEHQCGLHVIAAADQFGRPAPKDAEAIEQTLRCLSTLYDFVIVDAGSTVNACTAVALHQADQVMLVANPDVPCLRNLPRLSDAVRIAGVVSERVRIVLNRAADRGVLQVGQIETALGRTIDFAVTSDYRTVATAVNAGVPISSLRPSELQSQLTIVARALAASQMAVT